MGSATFIFSQLIILLFLAAPVFVCIRAVVLAVTRPKNHAAEPACERCRYRIAGLNVFTCPECGTDLRRTGIITPAMEMRRRGSTAGAIVGWTFIMVALGLVVFSAASLMMVNQFASGGMRNASTFVPRSAAYTNVEVASSFTFTGGPPTASATVATLTDSAGEVWTLTVTPGACISDGPRGGPSAVNGACDVEVATAFLKRAGVNTEDPAVAKEAVELVTLITAQAASPTAPIGRSATLSAFTLSGFTTAPIGTAARPSSGTWFAVFAAVGSIILFALWVGGIIFIVLRRGALMKEARRYDWDGHERREPRAPSPAPA